MNRQWSVAGDDTGPPPDERNHQGLGNKLIAGADELPVEGEVVRRERLGGMLSLYHRDGRKAA